VGGGIVSRTIFWSWQSDQSARVTRNLIRDALKTAIANLSAEMDEAQRPEIDHDTKDTPGTPDIVATILAKIEQASIFVADVTPICVTAAGKHVANPNVMIELGYAKKALGLDRIILVWNTGVTNARPEDLPFDMRHRRAPLEISLKQDATTDDIRTARSKLAKQLEDAIRTTLSAIPNKPSALPNWHPHEPNIPSLWKSGAQPLPINSREDGTIQITMDGLPRAYARLIPSHWNIKENALTILNNTFRHPVPLGGYGGLDWGATTGGFVSYRSSPSNRARGGTQTATRWFRDTGELWGIASSFFSENEEGSNVFASEYSKDRWTAWLSGNLKVCLETGGEGPFHIILGLEGLLGSYWLSHSSRQRARFQAIETHMQSEFTLDDPSTEDIEKMIYKTMKKAENAYGVG
jgi:hypothetical protein